MMDSLINLLRVKHYIKNILILVPLLCSGRFMTTTDQLFVVTLAFISFSLVSSSIYIINDIKDKETDARHPWKCHRPIASGTVSISNAIILSAVLASISIGLSVYLSVQSSWAVTGVLLIYLILNLAYSLYLKHVPIIEIAILSSGFLLRVLYGGFATGIEVSAWLYLTVLSFSFYMGLGKRRNEFQKHAQRETRKVLSNYSQRFLDRNMYMFLALTICFYSLWTKEQGNWALASVPIVMLSCMRYSLMVENESDGDPIEVILNDKWLLFMGGFYAFYMFAALYLI